MKNDQLTHLCLMAHSIALERGECIPAERPEFLWAPMRMVCGVPVFDGDRLREDQVDDLLASLERITGRKALQNTFQAVVDYMMAFGAFGMRLQDVTTGTGAGRTSVQRALTRLVDTGQVQYREEKTRGDGTRRKRYFWIGSHPTYAEEEITLDDLTVYADTDFRSQDDTGIRHHGTAVQSVTCSCARCSAAFDAWATDYGVSAARQAGGTGLAAGVRAHTRRRLVDEHRFRQAVHAG